MSGAEADISSDGETSFEDEDVPLPPSPLKEGTEEPFQVVLKGGSPWGFTLQSGPESKSSVLISNIEEDGKAWASGQLRPGDYVLQVNEIRCMSVHVAQELIDSAFRTLTLLIWRGTSDSLSPPVRSASFLAKTRELSERARQAAVQDDSVLFSESKGSAGRMKPRQRRIESFHGSRRGSTPASSSPASVSSTPRASQHGEGSPSTPPTSSSEVAKPGLKGWATEHDLTSRQPVIMSGSHVTRNVPLSPAKSTPTLNQEDLVNNVAARGYNPKTPTSHSNMTKSTTDIPEHVNYENVTSPTSPKSPSWYQQKLPNRSMFDFTSTVNSRRTSGSPRNSYAGASPRNSYSSGSPRNSYASGSPRNSYAGYSSSHVPSNYPQSPGFAPQSLIGSMFSQTFTDSNHSSANYSKDQKQTASSSRTFSYDDTPTHVSNKNYDRRSLPPQALQQFRQEFQQEQKQESQKTLTSMPVTQEEEELDREIPNIKPGPLNDFDRRPMYSPPAPPVRDISSLKYVSYSKQNHEKYPSWPVTVGQPPQNLGPPIDTQQSEKGSDSDAKTENSDKTEKIQVKFVKPEGKRSPSADRRGDDSKQNRNQSDPGFKQRPKKSFYTTRKPKEPSIDNTKSEGERFEEFYSQSKPGYPPPKLDPDGHNYGDEKYSIPSPPERDMPGLDEKSLVQKIAAVISPNSSFQPTYHHTIQYNMAVENTRSHGTESKSHGYRIPGTYFQQAMNAQHLLHTKSSPNRSMVDSGTSPLQSPTDEKGKGNSRTRNENVSSKEKARGVIVTQKPYYNTSTQTDDTLEDQSDQTLAENMNQSRHNENQNQPRHGSVSSAASTMRSDASTYSSGIGSMTFSDHSSAPMLRKLSEEFYRGKLSGIVPNEKRMSSASAYDELKSPRNENVFGELKEAESYSSVIIHAHEPAGLFGRDEVSSPSTGSRPEVSDSEHEHGTDVRYKPRYSMDAAMLLNKGIPSRGLNETRFPSESNLSGAGYSQRSHSQSLIHLNRPSSSLGEAIQSRHFSQSAYSSSSSSSRPHGSMEARSSGSRVSSESSTKGDKSRNGSDSVFYDKSSPVASDNNLDKNSETVKSSTLGRKESMKMAYGTFDENEHHYATPYAHQRNSSEVLSSPLPDSNVSHGRSMSFNDYMPMHYGTSDAGRLDQITEEGSEIRWQEAVKKSKSLSRIGNSNYENFNVSDDSKSAKTSDSDKSDTEKKKETKTGLRRFASEQIKPKKHDKRQQADSGKSGYSSSSAESSKGNKSDPENVLKSLTQQNMSDSDLKRVQQRALLDFVERKTEKTKVTDIPDQLNVKNTTLSADNPTQTPLESSPPPAPLTPNPSSPYADFTKRYNYTKAQRNESLRRTQSITSNSSRDSASDYMQMKRSEHSHQTEWSRLRSQESPVPRRPLSIGSDTLSVEHQHSLSAGTTPDDEPSHHRSSSETIPKHILAEQDRQETMLDTVIPAQGNNEGMVTAPIYHNLSGGGDYPRRPPPPVPGLNEDAPPALPPRSGQRFTSSRSESFLLSKVDQKQREEMKASYTPDGGSSGTSRWESSGTGTLKQDAYAQQLRRQAKRFSEQHKPISMQVVSTKSTVQVSLSQSYKQEPVSVLEAVPVSDPTLSPTQGDVKLLQSHHSPPFPRDRITPEPPPFGRDRITPDLPPLPTPMKNGETEIAVDLNVTADFPPPPAEFLGEQEPNDRCADDSYGSYKTRTAPREVGRYKRTTSDSSLLRSHPEYKPFQPHPDLSSRDVAESTPNKPPRKKLEQGRDSPTGYRSNSPCVETNTANQKTPSQVPAFHSAEVTSVQHAPKSMAQPLQSSSEHSPISSANTSGSFVSTVVQRPAMSQQDRNAAPEEPRQSVKDRVKNIEVFTHSPLASRSARPGNSVPEEKPVNAADSLEQLENSIKSSESLHDRLRPVVKRSEPEQTDHYIAAERVSSDASDSAKITPPVPNRTYRQNPGNQGDREYRKNSFQNHTAGPRPFVNKTSESANIHNPLNQNHVVNYKHDSRPDISRSPAQSVPEPQVPARPQKHFIDQNSNFPSPDSRLVLNSEEKMQNFGVQNGSKRNNELLLGRSSTPGGSYGSRSSENQQSDTSVVSIQNRYPHEQKRGDHPHRNVQRGGTPQDQRHVPHDPRTPDPNKNTKSDSYSNNWRSNLKQVDNHSANLPQSSTDSDIKNDSINKGSSTSPSRSQESTTVLDRERSTSNLVTVKHGRQPSAEELECDQKAQELAHVLRDSDKQLSEVLISDSNKIRMQYLDGILPVEPEVEKRPRTSTRTGSSGEEKQDKEEEPTSPMPSNYYVSPPKAMIELEIRKFGDQLTQDIGDNDALAQKKEELLQRMIKKVDILKDDRKELLSDIDENESLGKQVVAYVEKKCRSQQEKDKYKSYIDDIDKIIRLLLKLSGLLARAENTIQGLTEDTSDKIKKMTYEKRDRLYQQHEDAKELKLDIDRRSEQVEAILQDCLSSEELDDYHYYIKMKSKYTIQMQELEDKITLGNEQIAALQKSIPNKTKS